MEVISNVRRRTGERPFYGLSQVFVVEGPALESALIISSPDLGQLDDTFEENELIDVSLTYSESVQVTGQPFLHLFHGNNSAPESQRETWQANYLGGSGTTRLSFAYTVQSDDRDSDGIQLNHRNVVDLNGGSIQGVASGTDAATFLDKGSGLTLIESLRLRRVKVDGSSSASATPRIESVAIVSDPKSGTNSDVYREGERIRVRVVFDRPVQVSGSPWMWISIRDEFSDRHTPRARAEYANQASPAVLEFVYTVKSDDFDRDGIQISAGSGKVIQLDDQSSILDDNGVAAALNFSSQYLNPNHKVLGNRSGPDSAIAFLTGLALSAGDDEVPLNQPFSETRLFNAASVGFGVLRITVEANTLNTRTIEFLDAGSNLLADADVDAADFQVDLLPGINKFKVRVTAEDGATTETYSVAVFRREASSVLGRLAPSHGTLEPALASDVQNYTVSVPQSVARLTLDAAAADPAATLEILDGTDAPIPDADETSAHHQIDLDEGENVILLRVTASGGRPIRDYTVTVTRASRPTAAAIRLEAAQGVKGSTLEVPLVLSESNSRPVVVTWSTADGTATAGTDYTAVTDTTVTIAPGERVASLRIETQPVRGRRGRDRHSTCAARAIPRRGARPGGDRDGGDHPRILGERKSFPSAGVAGSGSGAQAGIRL